MRAPGPVTELNPVTHFLSLGSRQASLVASDRLYGAKKQVLDSMGMANPEEFPITTNGMPLQMLSYLRLARLQDPAEFAKARASPALILVFQPMVFTGRLNFDTPDHAHRKSHSIISSWMVERINRGVCWYACLRATRSAALLTVTHRTLSGVIKGAVSSTVVCSWHAVCHNSIVNRRQLSGPIRPSPADSIATCCAGLVRQGRDHQPSQRVRGAPAAHGRLPGPAQRLPRCSRCLCSQPALTLVG